MNRPVVGNDVVDLDDPRTKDRHLDPRFVERVLSVAERRVLAAAPDPQVELWRMWASKEAAYKVVSKLLGAPPVFVHASFVVAWADADTDVRSGTVTYAPFQVPVTVRLADTLIHAVAIAPGQGNPNPVIAQRLMGSEALEELLVRLSDREAEPVHSAASAAVRLAARAGLAELLSVDENRLEIVCDPGVTGRRPPKVLLDGAAAPADVSLSHHGRWIGWAAMPQNPAGR